MWPFKRKEPEAETRSSGTGYTTQVMQARADYIAGVERRHGEHDFGRIDIKGSRFFWKLDYYDLQCRGGSPDPSDPAVTTRVLTIMRAEEY